MQNTQETITAEQKSELIYGLEDRPPFRDTFFAALQHLLAIFVAIITPPLIIAGALNLDLATTSFLVSMALFASGISTFIQCKRVGPLGCGLLCIQGTSFSFISPIISAGLTGGLSSIFGAVIAGSVVEMGISRALKYTRRIITPLVSGIVVTLIGMSLIKVGITACGGGFGAMEDGTFGSLQNVGIAALVLSNLGYLWADGLFAALLGVYILKGSIHIGLTAIETLLDRSFSASEHETIIRRLMEIPGIKSLHDLRTRRAGPQCFIQCHIVIDGHVTLKAAHDIASASERALEKLYPDADIMIHMEPDEDATYQDIRFYGKADLHGAEEPSLKENCPLQESGWQRDNKLKQQALKLEQEAKVKAQDKSLSFEEQWAVEEEEEISSKNLKEKLESLKHESGGKREKW